MLKKISSKYAYKKKLGSVSVERYILYFVKLYFKSNSPLTVLLFYCFYIK